MARFHSQVEATNAVSSFHDRFAKGKMPDEKDIPEQQLYLEDIIDAVHEDEREVPLVKLLKEAGLCPSTSHASRMLKQGAVKINGEKVTDLKLAVKVDTNDFYQVGKMKPGNYLRIKFLSKKG